LRTVSIPDTLQFSIPALQDTEQINNYIQGRETNTNELQQSCKLITDK